LMTEQTNNASADGAFHFVIFKNTISSKIF
jgi:hypothetical protein